MRLGRDLDLRRRKHAKEISRQLAPRFPELQPYDLAGAWIEFSKTRVRLLGNSRVWVVALKANPGNVRLGVVVPFDPHVHRPERSRPGSVEWVILDLLLEHHRQSWGVGDVDAIGNDRARDQPVPWQPLRAPNKKRFWDAVVVDGVYGETSCQ